MKLLKISTSLLVLTSPLLVLSRTTQSQAKHTSQPQTQEKKQTVNVVGSVVAYRYSFDRPGASPFKKVTTLIIRERKKNGPPRYLKVSYIYLEPGAIPFELFDAKTRRFKLTPERTCGAALEEARAAWKKHLGPAGKEFEITNRPIKGRDINYLVDLDWQRTKGAESLDLTNVESMPCYILLAEDYRAT